MLNWWFCLPTYDSSLFLRGNQLFLKVLTKKLNRKQFRKLFPVIGCVEDQDVIRFASEEKIGSPSLGTCPR